MFKTDSTTIETLCTRCGLCCDGTLFADVELTGAVEAVPLEGLGLEVDEDAEEGCLLVQPCAALTGKRCRIYAHRPECCRTFECRLLQQVQSGRIAPKAALAKIAATQRQVARVEQLLRQLGAPRDRLPLVERCQEASSPLETDPDTPRVAKLRAELSVAMAGLETAIQKTFLGL